MTGSMDDHPLFTGDYLFTTLPSGRQLAVWRVPVFPVGFSITWRVCKRVEDKADGGEHWTVTWDHERFEAGADFIDFLKKNGLEKTTWWVPLSGTVIDV